MEPATLLATIAPEFATVDATGAIGVAELQIAAGLCGDQRPLLVAYLAAHILTVAGRAGAGGSVASLKEGQLSINYTTSAGGTLQSTSYGSEYDRLSRACIFTPRTRVTHV